MNKEELIEHLRHRHPGIRGVRDPIASEYDRSLLDRWHAEDHERHGEHSDVLLRRRAEAAVAAPVERKRRNADEEGPWCSYCRWTEGTEHVCGLLICSACYARMEHDEYCAGPRRSRSEF